MEQNLSPIELSEDIDYSFTNRPELQPYQDQIITFAETLRKYWPEWEYHNFHKHALETVDEFLILVDYGREFGIDMSSDFVVAGVMSALEHDVLNQDGMPHMYDSMEHRSAEVGRSLSAKLNISKEINDMKYAATLATRPGSKCTTLLDVMIRRADVANLGWEYGRFVDKTIKYWQETQAGSNDPKTFSHWVRLEIVQEKLLELLDEDLSMGDFDRDPTTGESFFQTDVFSNFKRLKEDLSSPDFVEPQFVQAA